MFIRTIIQICNKLIGLQFLTIVPLIKKMFTGTIIILIYNKLISLTVSPFLKKREGGGGRWIRNKVMSVVA